MVKSDFSRKEKLFLAYPEGFSKEYEKLTPFYEELISLIPDNIHQYIIVKNQKAGDKIKKLFPDKNLETVLIYDFEEIWLRDIMGFFIGKKKIVKPIFKPDYFTKTYNKKYLQKLDRQVRQIIDKTIGLEIIDLPLVLDGGNVVSNGEIAIITDKIYRDNPTRKKEEVNELIEEYLKVKPFIIPQMHNDKLGHSDGYISFLKKYWILISEYPIYLKCFDKENNYLEEIREELKYQRFYVRSMYDRPVDEKSQGKGDWIYSARGVYNNYLRLNNTIILPEYTQIDSTIDYNKLNKNRLINLGFKVKTINCDLLSTEGGLLRCISFTC